MTLQFLKQISVCQMTKLFSFLLFIIISTSFGQKVYSVEYINQADIKVFVVEYANQADLKVYIVKYANQAKDNEGKWFFTEHSNQADKKIYFVEYKNQSDLKIYFVDYQNQAGWRNRSKIYLLY